jgi:class 3 adenylate cyclase
VRIGAIGAGELRGIQKTSTMAQDAKLERKLTTIFSADVAGYSGLMERDEAGTMAELRETRRLLSVFIERHRGRVVNTAGDGLLAEFASVVEAVLCAIEIQRELVVRNSPPEATARSRDLPVPEGARRRSRLRRTNPRSPPSRRPG